MKSIKWRSQSRINVMKAGIIIFQSRTRDKITCSDDWPWSFACIIFCLLLLPTIKLLRISFYHAFPNPFSSHCIFKNIFCSLICFFWRDMRMGTDYSFKDDDRFGLAQSLQNRSLVSLQFWSKQDKDRTMRSHNIF